MAVSESFLESLGDLLGFVPELRNRRMFGGAGLYTGERMFAVADDDVLYLKVDAETRPAFEAAGSEPFVYGEKDGEPLVMNGYWRAPEAVWDDEEQARAWTRLAIDAALRAKAPKPKKRP
ncbi:MAG TPA: TfoX/Sxy family protein [Caulobacteraceae bacterium]|nr:TfoX/Sxy family protein [Caulobacteraceae bacterium]